MEACGPPLSLGVRLFRPSQWFILSPKRNRDWEVDEMKAEIEELIRTGEALADRVRRQLPISGADSLTKWNVARSKAERKMAAGHQGPKARTTDPNTAKAAAIRNRPRAGSQRERLYAAVRSAGPRGMTAEEAAGKTGIRLNSASTRMSELVRGDWLAESHGGTRKTSGGEQAIVYIVKRQMARFVVEFENPYRDETEEFFCMTAADAALRVDDLATNVDATEIEGLLESGDPDYDVIEWEGHSTGEVVRLRRVKESE